MGLGNPDPKYQNTYHNIGILAIRWLAKKWSGNKGIPPKWKKLKNLFQYTKIGALTFVEPLVHMNEIGKAAIAGFKRFKAAPAEFLVIQDDSDLSLGEFRLSFNRGSAGHKGVESIIKSLGNKGFWRMRIGIRKEAWERQKAGEFVLKEISPINKKIFLSVFEKIEETIKSAIQRESH